MTGGSLIDTAFGFSRTPSTVPTTYADREYSMFWYQPTYEHAYGSKTLRRYNGGASNGDKVRAYCVSLRPTDSLASTYIEQLALVPATEGGNAGILTLNGAKALITGAVALGTIVLAF
jgi:hypothetical protein